MQQPKENTPTSKDLSPEEVELSFISFDGRLKNGKVDRELLQRAWHTAQLFQNLYKELVLYPHLNEG